MSNAAKDTLCMWFVCAFIGIAGGLALGCGSDNNHTAAASGNSDQSLPERIRNSCGEFGVTGVTAIQDGANGSGYSEGTISFIVTCSNGVVSQVDK